MRVVRFILAAVALAVIGLVVGVFVDPPSTGVGGFLVEAADGAHALLGTVATGLWVLAAAAFQYPLVALVVLAVTATPAVVARIIEALPRAVHKDSQRMFTSDQRREGNARANGQCEMEGVFFTRCARPGEHGDHWFPHSKGGASSMNNFVWACAPCNLAKSAHVPTFWETTRLEWRRRRYFDPTAQMRPGEKVRVR